jgi:hypothetical protein
MCVTTYMSFQTTVTVEWLQPPSSTSIVQITTDSHHCAVTAGGHLHHERHPEAGLSGQQLHFHRAPFAVLVWVYESSGQVGGCEVVSCSR